MKALKIFLAAILLLSIVGCPEDHREQCPDGIYVETLSDEQDEMLSLINDARADAGVQPLTLTLLKLVAIDHSQDMACRDFFDHINPDGEGPADRVSNGLSESYPLPYRHISENIGGRNTPSARVQFDSWMDSEGHRKNMLNELDTDVGIGAVYKSSGSTYTHYWTAIFVGRN